MCWNCRNNTGRPHVGGKGRLPKAQEEAIERRVAEDIAANTRTFACVICGRPYQEYSRDGRQSWGMCGACPKVERTPEERAVIHARLEGLRRFKQPRTDC